MTVMKKLYITFFILAVLATAGTIAVAYDLAAGVFRDREAVTREYVVRKSEEETVTETEPQVAVQADPEKKDVYRLRAYYGKVAVYTSDGRLHDYTDIELKSLPRSLQTAILNTYCVMGEDELYDFLETYSS